MRLQSAGPQGQAPQFNASLVATGHIHPMFSSQQQGIQQAQAQPQQARPQPQQAGSDIIDDNTTDDGEEEDSVSTPPSSLALPNNVSACDLL